MATTISTAQIEALRLLDINGGRVRPFGSERPDVETAPEITLCSAPTLAVLERNGFVGVWEAVLPFRVTFVALTDSGRAVLAQEGA